MGGRPGSTGAQAQRPRRRGIIRASRNAPGRALTRVRRFRLRLEDRQTPAVLSDQDSAFLRAVATRLDEDPGRPIFVAEFVRELGMAVDDSIRAAMALGVRYVDVRPHPSLAGLHGVTIMGLTRGRPPRRGLWPSGDTRRRPARVRLTIAGETIEVGPGDSYVIPAYVPHSLVVVSAGEVVDVFTRPARITADAQLIGRMPARHRLPRRRLAAA